MSVEAIVASWREVRSGLVEKRPRFPPTSFRFRRQKGCARSRNFFSISLNRRNPRRRGLPAGYQLDAQVICRTNQRLRARRPRC
jgi:hypothetical protein